MKNNLYRKGFIVPVLIIIIALLVIGGGVYFYKNKKVEAPVVVNESENVGLDNQQGVAPINTTVKNTNTKSFKLGTLEFSYPDILTLSKNGETTSLNHSIPYKHQDSCDMKGDSPMLNNVTDFSSSFSLYSTNIINSIKKDNPNGYTDMIKDGVISIQLGFIDKYKIGSFNGYSISMGVEGCGVNKYYFPISTNQTLVVSKSFYAQSLGQVWNPNIADKLQGLIPRDKEEQIFEDILSSVTGLPNQKTMSVKLYFPNRIFNPESFDCSLVYSVNRVIPYTQAVAAATLAELIKGPTTEEQKNGYFGTIPDGTKVNSIKIVNGVLFVDFNKEAESGGGSCGQASKGSSIVKTLTQFSTVKSIQMSVEGNSNPSEIFQP